MTKKIVVLGGGTGTFPVVSGLKRCTDFEISSIIAVSDSGGSTGKIRDEFGFQPVGDLRQALAALAESEGEEWIRKILLYRFDKGTGLQGHNLGNLILTALQDMTGDTTESLEIAEKVFRLEGRVIPVTKDNVNLQIQYADGSVEVGEHTLDEKQEKLRKIAQIQLVPHATINPSAEEALKEADMIIIGPGDYYASLMATLVPDKVKETLQHSRAKVVYILNLMTRFTQTPDMTALDHVKGIEEAIGRQVDVIVVNSTEIPQAILDLYAAEKEFPVVDDLDGDPRVVRADILSEKLAAAVAYDTAHRSLLRHDAQKIGNLLIGLSEI